MCHLCGVMRDHALHCPHCCTCSSHAGMLPCLPFGLCPPGLILGTCSSLWAAWSCPPGDAALCHGHAHRSPWAPIPQASCAVRDHSELCRHHLRLGVYCLWLWGLEPTASAPAEWFAGATQSTGSCVSCSSQTCSSCLPGTHSLLLLVAAREPCLLLPLLGTKG